MVGDAFEQALVAGRRAWPHIELDPGGFRRHLQQVLGTASEQRTLPHAADLYLACACSLQVRGAREGLDSVVLELAKHWGSAAPLTNAAWAALHGALLGPGSPLARYDGSAPLAPWLSVVGARVVMNALWQNARTTSAPRPN